MICEIRVEVRHQQVGPGFLDGIFVLVSAAGIWIHHPSPRCTNVRPRMRLVRFFSRSGRLASAAISNPSR